MRGSAEAAKEWSEARMRVVALLRGVQATAPERLGERVPACPDWTVLELLSHVVGLGADVLADREDAVHAPEWTQAQVDARRDRTLDEVLAEWAGFADAMHRYLSEVDTRPLGDLVIHEQDLRGALGEPGARDTAGLRAIRYRMAQRLADRLEGRAPLRFAGEDWTWTSGPGEPGVVLAADGFDAFRALTSRRSADQLRGWVVEGDLEPYLEAFGGLGALPAAPLPEGAATRPDRPA
ncbi:uncharacterized protein (TIGR03083 family) [Friedmanniella endophytica]|uniref:Uncharacterized protein (TIGR03083 family) n=1 Tax=Microlunatus kandeliicorticis TaxID=1759536 RepID=A0A7W3ISQ9_9ACTN|nr:maleylpyruvate isomerase N-terminal domain-containing protein [Microlunatus kandeliicorticis]MBA8794559.1 uncharacterized protein (TIGR03083 family) [Microlunatus kandeliicorticis]